MRRFAYLLTMIALMLMLAAPAWGAPSLTATAQLANQGRVRPGDWATVLVDLNNQGAELSGELTVDSAQGQGEHPPQFVVPLTLPAGGKKRVPVYVPLQGSGQLVVRFQSGGAKLYEQTLDLITLPSQSLLIGVLSDDELGIPALASLGAGRSGRNGGDAQVSRMDAATFPTRAPLLSSFDVIAISRFDSATLSAEQLQALESWVGKGGTLLLAGGPEWQRTLKPLPASLLPVQVTGTGEADIAPLTALSDKPLAAAAPVSQAVVVRGEAVASSGTVPLLVTDRVGLGKVLYLAVDPGLAPMVTWQGQPDLFTHFIASNRHGSDCVGCTQGRYESALRQIPGLGLPSLWLVGGLLGAYLLLIAPANYLILKRLDRRELSWATIPALSLGFVAAIYFVGLGGRSSLLAHMITVTEVSPGTRAATQTAYVGVYAPSRDHLEVSLGSSRLVKPLFSFQGGAGQEPSSRIVAGDKTTVQLLNMNNYTMRGFSMEQDVAVTGGIELADASVDANGNLTARVVNRLSQPLTEVTINASSDTRRIGDLAPGASSDPITLVLTGDMSGNPKNNMNMARGVLLGPSATPDQRRRSQVLETALFPDYGSTANRQIKIAGFTPEPLSAVSLPEVGRLVQGTNLVFVTLPIPVDLTSGDLPPGVVQGVLTDGPGWGQSPGGYMLAQGAYTFNLYLPAIDRAKVTELRLVVQRFQGGSYTLSAMNERTGQWVELKPETSQPLPNWQEFVGKGGLMQVKIDATDHLEIAPPTISAKGVAR